MNGFTYDGSSVIVSVVPMTQPDFVLRMRLGCVTSAVSVCSMLRSFHFTFDHKQYHHNVQRNV